MCVHYVYDIQDACTLCIIIVRVSVSIMYNLCALCITIVHDVHNAVSVYFVAVC